MLTNLTQIQISGLIALLVSTPFLIKSVRNFYFAMASKKWPKVSGTIIEMPLFGRKHNLQYAYTVNRNMIKSHRICFTNTSRPINQGGREFKEKYALNRIVDVFYNPTNPKQAVLEPGRNDGLLFAIVLLVVVFVFGCLAFFDQTSLFELIGLNFQIK